MAHLHKIIMNHCKKLEKYKFSRETKQNKTTKHVLLAVQVSYNNAICVDWTVYLFHTAWWIDVISLITSFKHDPRDRLMTPRVNSWPRANSWRLARLKTLTAASCKTRTEASSRQQPSSRFVLRIQLPGACSWKMPNSVLRKEKFCILL